MTMISDIDIVIPRENNQMTNNITDFWGKLYPNDHFRTKYTALYLEIEDNNIHSEKLRFLRYFNY